MLRRCYQFLFMLLWYDLMSTGPAANLRRRGRLLGTLRGQVPKCGVRLRVIPDVTRDRICLHVAVEAAAFIDLRDVELHRSLVLGLDQTISPRTM